MNIHPGWVVKYDWLVFPTAINIGLKLLYVFEVIFTRI